MSLGLDLEKRFTQVSRLSLAEERTSPRLTKMSLEKRGSVDSCSRWDLTVCWVCSVDEVVARQKEEARDAHNFPSSTWNFTSPLIDLSSKQIITMSTAELTPLNGTSIRGLRSCRVKNEDVIFVQLVVIAFAIITLCCSIFVVPPGMVGVVVTFGHVKAHQHGLHVRTPYVSSLEIFSAKTQKLEEVNTTPTKEGLSVQLATVVLFRLDENMVKELYTTVGPDFVNTLLQPEANSAVRCYTSDSEAKDLYTSGRRDIQDELKANLSEKLQPRGIIIEDVLLKDLHLPEMLARSIELKLETEQQAKQMVFVLEKEQQEAQRKAIEAEGIAAFQHIVSEGISSKLLQWKGIEATEILAKSPNSKLVVMGNGDNGLPVLLSASEQMAFDDHEHDHQIPSKPSTGSNAPRGSDL